MLNDHDRQGEDDSLSSETGTVGVVSQPQANASNHLAAFNQHRALLLSVAYRMLGSRVDAEDMVQETFLRWQQASHVEVQDPRAFLVTVLTRLCINQLQSARVKREQYFGQWLPEPLPTGRRRGNCRCPGLTDRFPWRSSYFSNA